MVFMVFHYLNQTKYLEAEPFVLDGVNYVPNFLKGLLRDDSGYRFYMEVYYIIVGSYIIALLAYLRVQ